MTSERVAQARKWIDEYTPKPHPDLGRDGAVCPFMVKTLRRGYLSMMGFDATRGDDALIALARQLREEMRERAAELGADAVHLVSMVVPFGVPEADLKAMVGRVHAALKPEFVRQGYMVGDFWPDHETVGLHSDDFRPFSSPIPIFGMRHIVPADLVFFVKHERSAEDLLLYLGHFRRLFDGRLSRYWAEQLDAAEAEARRAVKAGP